MLIFSVFTSLLVSTFAGNILLPPCDLSQAFISDCFATITSDWVLHQDTELRDVHISCDVDSESEGGCIVSNNFNLKMTFTTIEGGPGSRCVYYNASGTLYLNNVHISGCGNLWKYNGGAVFADGITGNTTVTITDSWFYNNKGVSGGAFCIGRGVFLTITNTYFSANLGSGHGGVIRLWLHATATIVNSTFTSNTAESSGGAISVSESKISLKDSTVIKNSANINGGGLEFYSDSKDHPASLETSNTQIDHNVSNGKGNNVYGTGWIDCSA